MDQPIFFEVGKMYRNPQTNEEIKVLAAVTMTLYGDVFIIESNKHPDVKSISQELQKGWHEIDEERYERNYFGDLIVYDTEPTTVEDRETGPNSKKKE